MILGLASVLALQGNSEEAIELMERGLAPEGTGYRARTRFAKFYNLPELMTMFREVADVKTADMMDLERPTPCYETVVVEPSNLQREMVQELSERAAAVQQQKVEPHVDNMLKITTDGRKIGLDQRLINPDLQYDQERKPTRTYRHLITIPAVGASPIEKRLIETSPRFAELFQQAARAENNGDFDLAASGYRNASEALIKDYAIRYLNVPSNQKLREKSFDSCIREYLSVLEATVSSYVVKELGNTATHYPIHPEAEEFDFDQLKKFLEIFLQQMNTKILTAETALRLPKRIQETIKQ